MPRNQLLDQLLSQPLAREDARILLHQVLSGLWSDQEIASFLLHLNTRTPTPTEIAGFVDAMRAAATPIPLTDSERSRLVDTCGTGGDASRTFNISTAAALVAAAAGATVAKHGNRAVTSTCGSADVLEALGIPVNLSPEAGAAALRLHRFAFLHAPTLHPAMKAVMPVRRALGVRTIFNLLGPLTNPAGASAQVMGVFSADLVPLVAEAMVLLGTRHAFVVHGDTGSSHSGMDEFSISGPTRIAEVRSGLFHTRSHHPQDFGLEPAPVSSLLGGDAPANALILRAIFAGDPGPRRNIVLLNAAAVLVTAGLAPDLSHALVLASAAIDSGAVTELVSTLSRTP